MHILQLLLLYLLGLDIGSSSIKAALVHASDGARVALVQSPDDLEMEIQSHQPGWAEQDPELWWFHVCKAIRQLLAQTDVSAKEIVSIGIAYQMHGLVLVDDEHKVLRPSIIWCDSRAVETGEKAYDTLTPEACLPRLLNSPGNFTAAKLRWVKEHEPHLYERIHKFMLPGDYIAMRLCGEPATTVSGLSEGILWDFQEQTPAHFLLDHWGISRNLLPDIVPTLGIQGRLHKEAALATGLAEGTPIGYRAGDQPNNALALNVLQPGEIAATGGTSGVVYGIADRPVYDTLGRVNGFAHVNHSADTPRIGILLCINGAGIQYGWLKKYMNPEGASYAALERMASTVPVGSDGLLVLPFGNGAERMLRSANPGAQVLHWQFNRHTNAHWYRAALEGVAFAFAHGMSILRDMGLNLGVIRVGNDNLFQSAVFSNTVASLAGCRIDLMNTSGALGAARAAGVAIHAFGTLEEAVGNVECISTFEPAQDRSAYQETFHQWQHALKRALEQT